MLKFCCIVGEDFVRSKDTRSWNELLNGGSHHEVNWLCAHVKSYNQQN